MELKYFKDCNDIASLKKEYIKLMKKYHPDLAPDESEVDFRNKICAEINAEYDILIKRMSILEKNSKHYDNLSNESEAAKNAYKNVVFDIQKPNIEFKYYYYVKDINWSENQILKEVDATVKLFWEICRTKNIVGDEFAKLYELCQGNAEKIKRTVMFLSTGAVPDSYIHANLQSDKAIPFFNDRIVVDNLPNYDSFLILSRESTKEETYSAWIEFCQRQREDFLNRYNEYVIPKISDSKKL